MINVKSCSDVPRFQYDRTLVIVGGGSVDDALLVELASMGAHLIGADGGADKIAALGMVPDAIVGDLDSLADFESWAGRSLVIRVEDQETTDFEKCLQLTDAPWTVGIGLTGKRFDHTMAAISALMRFSRDRKIVLLDEQDLILGVRGRFEFMVNPGDRVSIYPLEPVTFEASSGLQFPLSGLKLEPGGRIGTSNVAVKGPFVVTPEFHCDGAWLLILDKKYVWRLIGLE